MIKTIYTNINYMCKLIKSNLKSVLNLANISIFTADVVLVFKSYSNLIAVVLKSH